MKTTRSNALAAMLCTAFAVVVFAATTTPASAQITFTLNDVNLVQGGYSAGTLTGWFELNSSLTQVLSYDITASTAAGQPPFTFAGAQYTTSDSAVVSPNGLGQASPNFQIDFTVGSDELRLILTSLGASGGTLATSSYETESGSGNRTVASGTVAAPEPSSGMLGLLAATGIYLLRPQRRGVK